MRVSILLTLFVATAFAEKQPTASQTPPPVISPTLFAILITVASLFGVGIIIIIISRISTRCLPCFYSDTPTTEIPNLNNPITPGCIKVVPVNQNEQTLLALNPPPENSEVACIICLERVSETEIILSPCGHLDFHWKCLKEWVAAAHSKNTRERCCRCMKKVDYVRKVVKRQSQQK